MLVVQEQLLLLLVAQRFVARSLAAVEVVDLEVLVSEVTGAPLSKKALHRRTLTLKET